MQGVPIDASGFLVAHRADVLFPVICLFVNRKFRILYVLLV